MTDQPEVPIKRPGSPRSALVVIFTVLGAVAIFFPMQKFMSLGRYQHYSLGVALFGIGHLVQLAVSWPKLRFWGRLSYGLTGMYFLMMAQDMWNNPWLDWRVAVQTEEKQLVCTKLMIEYFLSFFLIILCWVRFGFEWKRMQTESTKFSAKESEPSG